MKRRKQNPGKKRADLRASSPPPTGKPSTFNLQPSTLPTWLLGGLLALATILAYLPVWHAGFVWDDVTLLIVDNPMIKAANGLYQFWFTTRALDYYPLTNSAWWLEWRLWGDHPLGYHLVNVLLHAANAILLWRVLARLKIPGAMLAAAIFALHPVNVESVAWISEMKNTLSFFFFALTLVWYLKFDATGRRRDYWISLGVFLVALFSKSAVAPLPVVLLGLAWWRRGRVTWADFRRSVPFFAAAFVLGLVTVWFQYHRVIGVEIVRTDSFWGRLAGAGWAVWFYLYKALWPLNLMFVYPRWNIDATNPLSYLPGLLLAAVFLVCWRQRGRWGKAVLFGLGYFVLLLLPVLGFLNDFFFRYSLVGDHWQYFAIPGPIALVAAALTIAWKGWGKSNLSLGIALAGGLLLALGMLTWKQAGNYKDEETLWRDTATKNPAAWMAHNNLGNTLCQRGRLDAAIVEFKKTLAIKPDYADADYNLGNTLLQKGQTDEAIAHFQKALAIKPDSAEYHNNLALALVKQGRADAAIREYQVALRFKPDDAMIHYNLGIAFFKQGQTDEAIREYQTAIRLKPDYDEAHNNLGHALYQKGRVVEAIVEFQKTLAIKPDYAEADYNLGIAFDQQGRRDEAIREYQTALRLKPDYAEARYNLGNNLLQKGQVDAAIVEFQKTLALKPDYAEASYNLGNALLQKGQVDAAISQFQKALAVKPDFTYAHNNLGAALLQKGQVDEAIVQFQKALAIQPDNLEARHDLARIAWVLATSPDASIRNGAKAVELARQADQLAGGKNPELAATLAAAYAEAGQFTEAITAAQRAMQLATSENNAALTAALKAQLKFYQAGSPFRDTGPTP
jgi:tetratricopeptide (TPR) repeat protein